MIGSKHKVPFSRLIGLMDTLFSLRVAKK